MSRARTKLLLAAGLVVVLSLAAPRAGASVVGLARALLVGSLLLGGGLWWSRRRKHGPVFKLAESLRVVSRKGLSPRCAVALVQAHGQHFLVTYGDTFAQVQPMIAPRRRRPRRVAGRRSVAESGVLQ